jgi:hypothetical protein
MWPRSKWQYGINTIQHNSVDAVQGTKPERTEQ